MGGTPSWFDKLTMRAAESRDAYETLILSVSKDEGRARGTKIPTVSLTWRGNLDLTPTTVILGPDPRTHLSP